MLDKLTDAKAEAKPFVLAKKKERGDSKWENCGESVFLAKKASKKAEEATEEWYKGEEHYDFAENKVKSAAKDVEKESA